MLNHISVIGRLTKDVELRTTQTGKAVAQLTIANEKDVKDASGNKQTLFLDVVAWNNTANFVAKYGTKGRLVCVSGSLNIRDWTDKEGNKHRNSEILADNLYFLDKAPQSNEAEKTFVPIEDDGDLPF